MRFRFPHRNRLNRQDAKTQSELAELQACLPERLCGSAPLRFSFSALFDDAT